MDVFMKNIKLKTVEIYYDEQEKNIDRDPMIKEYRVIVEKSKTQSQIVYQRLSFGPFASDRDSVVESNWFDIGPNKRMFTS